MSLGQLATPIDPFNSVQIYRSSAARLVSKDLSSGWSSEHFSQYLPENMFTPSLRYLISPARVVQEGIDDAHTRLLKIKEHLQHLEDIAVRSQAHVDSSRSIITSSIGTLQSNIFTLSTSGADQGNHIVDTNVLRPKSPSGLNRKLKE